MGGHGPAERPTCVRCNAWADQCACTPATTSWWSTSRGDWVELADLHDSHLFAAFRKFDRGDYRVPGEAGFFVALTTEERVALHRALLDEFKRRGLDPFAPKPEGGAA